MSAKREDVIGAIRRAQQEAEGIVSSASEATWSKDAYEQGWNAKQLLCHIASTSGVASYLIAMAKAPGSAGIGGGFDVDAWNAQAVAERQDKPLAEILDELRAACQRGIESVGNAPNELLAQHLRTPWGVEGPLADVIVGSIDEHLAMHMRDLAKAVS